MSQIWSKFVLAMHTYNFVTIFYFLGIEGFPSGMWLILEIFTEIMIVTDFILRIVIRKNFPEIWDDMWLLHDKGQKSLFHFVIRLVGSIPQSLILCMIYRKDFSQLTAFSFALLRCAKLLRLR